jgi:hypothetical protein
MDTIASYTYIGFSVIEQPAVFVAAVLRIVLKREYMDEFTFQATTHLDEFIQA